MDPFTNVPFLWVHVNTFVFHTNLKMHVAMTLCSFGGCASKKNRNKNHSKRIWLDMITGSYVYKTSPHNQWQAFLFTSNSLFDPAEEIRKYVSYSFLPLVLQIFKRGIRKGRTRPRIRSCFVLGILFFVGSSFLLLLSHAAEMVSLEQNHYSHVLK